MQAWVWWVWCRKRSPRWMDGLLESRIKCPVAKGRENLEKKSSGRRATRYNKQKKGLVALLTLAQLVAAMSRRNCAGLRGFDVP